jgi:hypothetical protein
MIKNYTSTVPADHSVVHIERRLVAQKAKNIMKQYGPTGKLDAIAFIVELNGHDMPFKLPAKVEQVYKKLTGAVRRARKGTMARIEDQAERTAWKLMADWVDVQMSLIELDQVEFLEVFLPYVYNPSTQQTFYEKIKGGGYKLLQPGN